MFVLTFNADEQAGFNEANKIPMLGRCNSFPVTVSVVGNVVQFHITYGGYYTGPPQCDRQLQ